MNYSLPCMRSSRYSSPALHKKGVVKGGLCPRLPHYSDDPEDVANVKTKQWDQANRQVYRSYSLNQSRHITEQNGIKKEL
ncbi:hypothetical protein chiPu_0003478 [Chiloscyllium punctatum]|uniref:Uncharacterized protein n=1 Tax=Chiloscyllium punctatum TaxID=137246 RepID=A0A401S3T4_CHIPU|nr:hypothetical protein [Chiloscyllium punctatum]